MSRFSGDMAMMDKMFAYIMDDMFQFTFLLLGLLITICFVLPEMIGILVVGLLVYGVGVVAVDRTNREAKREANAALSPVITTLAETITGNDSFLMLCRVHLHSFHFIFLLMSSFRSHIATINIYRQDVRCCMPCNLKRSLLKRSLDMSKIIYGLHILVVPPFKPASC